MSAAKSTTTSAEKSATTSGATSGAESSSVALRPAIPETELSAGFWEGVRAGRLVIQRCLHCGLLRHYPQPMCPACRRLGFDWAPVSGRGRIYSWERPWYPAHPAVATGSRLSGSSTSSTLRPLPSISWRW